jgi:hypothetical protein
VIKQLLMMSRITYEATENQYFELYHTKKTYVLWEVNGEFTRKVRSFNVKNVVSVNRMKLP